MGGAIGVLLTHWGVALVRLLGKAHIPSLTDLSVDGRALGFALLASLLVAVAVQVFPILGALSKDPLDTLRDRSGRPTAEYRRVGRYATAVVEIGIALLLMIAAALSTQTVFRLSEVASGIDPNGILSMSIELPQSKYAVSLEHKRSTREAATQDPASLEDSGHPLEKFQQTLTAEVSRLPGLAAVGFVSQLPLSSSVGRRLSVRAEGANATFALFYYVGGEYFRAMGIPLERGRYFNRDDMQVGQKVVIVNQSLARLYWPESDTVGRRITLADESEPREVVGVVGDVRQTGLTKVAEPQFYIPYLQPYRGKFPALRMSLVARTDGDPKAILPLVRGVISSLDKDLAVFRVRTMQEVVSESISAYKFRASLLGIFASLGVLLAVFGIFGVIAFMVKARTHEIGIRISVGATSGQIMMMVLRHGAVLAFLGVAAGTAAAIALTRLMSSLLYGVQPLDTRTLIGSGTIVFTTALLACLAPALIASRVDPVRALRHE